MKPQGSTKDGKVGPKGQCEQRPLEPCSHSDDAHEEGGDSSPGLAPGALSEVEGSPS